MSSGIANAYGRIIFDPPRYFPPDTRFCHDEIVIDEAKRSVTGITEIARRGGTISE